LGRQKGSDIALKLPCLFVRIMAAATAKMHSRSSSRGLDGKASAAMRRKAGTTKHRSLVDDLATQQFLRDLLTSKNTGDEILAEAEDEDAGPARQAASGNISTKALRIDSTSPVIEPTPAAVQLSAMELEEERRQFVNKVCSDRTRPDVRDWVGKIFSMDQSLQAAASMREAKEKRRRRRTSSGSAASDSGLSGQTGYTGVTGTTATAMQTVGGSIAAPSHRPKSVDSAESLVVHHSKGDEPLSMKERIQALLENRVPELAEHIDAHVAKLTDELQKEVDEEVAEQFLRTAGSRKVFDGRANYLRWQNARHQALQQRLDAKMGKWILEGIETWDQRKAAGSKPEEVNETDLIFDYLTKRAAHIDSGKLPSQIPVFKTLRASYSLPRMWQDKYTAY